MHSHSLRARTMAVAAVVLIAGGLATISPTAARADAAPAPESLRTAEPTPLTLSCSAGGFTGEARFTVRHDTAAHTIALTADSYVITAPAGEESGRMSTLSHSLGERSFVYGIPERTRSRELPVLLHQDGVPRDVSDAITVDDNPAVYFAGIAFTFDASGTSDPTCVATAAAFEVAPDQPVTGEQCSASDVGWTTKCWRAASDTVMAVRIAEKNVDNPEYLILDAQDDPVLRGRLDDGYSRIWLDAGQSFVLTAPSESFRTNRIALVSARPAGEVQPEFGETCAGTRNTVAQCFVIAPTKNFVLGVLVTSTPFGNPPDYAVRDKNGVWKEGGPLHMGSEGSNIRVAAGDRLSISAPTLPHHKNVIMLTHVTPY